MKEKILEIIGNSLDKLNVYVYDVVYEKEGGFIVFAIGALIIPWFVIKTLLTFVL